MPEAILDVRCWYCERIYVYRKGRGELTDDGRYLCPKCIKTLKPLNRRPAAPARQPTREEPS